jgi:anti-sigma factor RsiW
MLDPPGGAVAGFHLGDSLSAYLDGELDTSSVSNVTHHLAACGACRDQLQELDAARTAIRALPRLDLPIDVGTGTAGFSPHRLRRPIAIAVAAAVTATLGISMMRSEPVAPLDLDNLATRHNARVSVESSFSVIPASLTTGSTP